MKSLQECLFHPAERKMPLDQPPVDALPPWGHWLQTSDCMVALIPPGPLEVNLRSPLHLIATSLGVTRGVAAFDSDRLQPYEARPGGVDVVPQGSTYCSVEEAASFVVFGYSSEFLSGRVAAGQTVELWPGQISRTPWAREAAIAMREFFGNGQVGGAFYLESVATTLLGQVIYRRSTLSRRLKRPPECLDPRLLRTSLDYIQAHVSQPLSLNDMAAAVGFSSYHFARAFKATTGLSPYQYVLRRRVDLAEKLLQEPGRSLADVAIAAGFGNQSHFTTVFRRVLQITPKQYQQQFFPRAGINSGDC